MKQAIFLLEDSKSGKSIKVPVRASYKPSVKVVFTLWERVPQTSFNLVSYLKSFASDMIDKLFGNENPRYYRSIIINESSYFIVFVWSGDILHEEVVRGLTTNREKLKLPSYNYDDLYQSSIGGYFQKNWCFPVVYDGGTVRSNLTKKQLIQFAKEEDGKNKLNISDTQWKTMLEEAW